MGVESAADRATFLSPDDFGDVGVYRPVATATDSDPIDGILNDPYLAVLTGGDVATSDSQPTFLLRSADLPAQARGGDGGDTLVVNTVTYRVVELQPDGAGMTLLTLGR